MVPPIGGGGRGIAYSVPEEHGTKDLDARTWQYHSNAALSTREVGD